MILSGQSLVVSKKISDDIQLLYDVSLNYLRLHENDKSKMNGVYKIYRKSANLLIPFSDKITLDYYDVSTGNHLGGISINGFGF